MNDSSPNTAGGCRRATVSLWSSLRTRTASRPERKKYRASLGAPCCRMMAPAAYCSTWQSGAISRNCSGPNSRKSSTVARKDSISLILFCRAGFGDYTLSLLDGDELIGGDVRQALLGPARPLNFQRRNLTVVAEPES